MVTRWGMSDKLGPVTLVGATDGMLGDAEAEPAMAARRPYSEDTARLIDDEVRRILEDSYADAVRLLMEHRRELDALAKALLAHETLDEQEIRDVTGLERTGSTLPLPMAA
jgi:cell division protease FtsH